MTWVSKMKHVVIIPARLESSRLSRKVLLPLGDRSILAHVYARATAAKEIDAVYIATDSQEIMKHCQGFTKNVIMTNTSHQSGTDRIAEAAESIDADVIVNVQGDEPFIDPTLITAVAKAVHPAACTMSSAMQRIAKTEELHDPNVVKVIVNHQNQALYFSRAAIPYPRDHTSQQLQEALDSRQIPYFHHIGIYGYTKSFLMEYAALSATLLEQSEKLEQLRALEHGHAIQMIETTHKAFGIDTQEDYRRALQTLKDTHA